MYRSVKVFEECEECKISVKESEKVEKKSVKNIKMCEDV
jgi:hypothetical protein